MSFVVVLTLFYATTSPKMRAGKAVYVSRALAMLFSSVLYAGMSCFLILAALPQRSTGATIYPPGAKVTPILLGAGSMPCTSEKSVAEMFAPIIFCE